MAYGRSATVVQRCSKAAFMAALFASASSCASVRHPSDDIPAPSATPATVHVENGRYADLIIMVLRASEQVQLGTVNSESSATFALPAAFANPAAPIRLVAAPIGGQALPISEEVTVYPGDRVNLVITPY